MLTLITDRQSILDKNPGWSWEDLSTVKENMNISSLSYIYKLLNERISKTNIKEKIKELNESSSN